MFFQHFYDWLVHRGFHQIATPLPASFKIENKKPDRREFLRGKLIQDQNGQTLC